MKYIFLLLPLVTGCGTLDRMTNLINQSTCSIHRNRAAVEQSTAAICHNAALIEESNKTIEENRQHLEGMK